ncbi:PAS domain-containing protein [Chromobacterium sp. LK11]|uniref:PAS domain-containing protein n=1 Tax=Chromobacterium sp. LK11 TaxID=1628212 RepID=UPI0012E19C4E|nr:PAS domain-containing protein [Chromobacterium sp. LK11]
MSPNQVSQALVPAGEETFAVRLKDVLGRKRVMLKQVAEALGVSSAAVHKWTRGGEIEYRKLRVLADFLGVNWIWLRYGEQAVLDLATATTTDAQLTEIRRKHLAEIMESEARMKFAQNVSGIVTWEWNILSDAVAYSANAEQLFGRPVRVLTDFWQALDPADAPALRARLEDCLNAGTAYEAEFRVRWPTGETRWIASRATCVPDAARRPVKMIGVSFDITQRCLAEQALRQSQAILDKAQSIAHLGSWFWDVRNDDCIWSDEAYRIFGWQPQAFKVTMERYFAAMAPEDRERIDQAIRRAIDERQPYCVEYSILLPDGRRRQIHEEGEVLYGEGRAEAMIGATQDVTDSRQAAVAYSESEERFREIFEQAALGLAHLGLDGRWLKVNRRLAEMTGYAPGEMEGMSFQQLTHPDDLEDNLLRLDRLLSGEVASFSLEKRLLRKQGGHVWVNVSVSLSRHPVSGEPWHLIAVAEEVAERRAARRSLEEARRRSELALQSIGMASWEWDLAAGRLRLSPQAARLLFGEPLEEAAEQRLLDGLRIASRQGWLASLEAIFNISSRAQLDVLWHGDGGKTLPLVLSLVAQRGSDGAVERLIGALGPR